MISISLCMIVKNEEDVLGRCLDSVRGIADEIIVADTGSGDRTREIAAAAGCRVYEFAWCDNFAAARNFSFSKARMSHCMWLDADDVIKEQDARELLLLKKTLPEDTDVVMMPYHTAFDSEGNATFSYYRERIVRNSDIFRWHGAVHEAISPSGKIVYSSAGICHMKNKPGDTMRNLRIFRGLIAKGHQLVPREQFYYARELYYHGEYSEAENVLQSLIKSGEGWIENRLEAYRTLAQCFMARGDNDSAVKTLLASFSEAAPRGEACCELGSCFMEKSDYRSAAYWFKAAARLTPNPESGGFVNVDCYGYIPYIELAVCYDRLGEYETAEHYNDLAGKIKPSSEAFLFNKEYFKNRKQKNV